MCGICGQFNFGSPVPVQRRDIEAMANSISHRGPDDEGYFIAGPLGFGFRRLSIIDLAGGHQPMSDGEESVWVVFNAEIYNFKEWGEDVLNRLNGMFGLAIWDVRQRKLILARDPFGIKLIYYRIEGDRL